MHKARWMNHILGTLDGLVRVNNTPGNPCIGSDHATFELWLPGYYHELALPRGSFETTAAVRLRFFFFILVIVIMTAPTAPLYLHFLQIL